MPSSSSGVVCVIVLSVVCSALASAACGVVGSFLVDGTESPEMFGWSGLALIAGLAGGAVFVLPIICAVLVFKRDSVSFEDLLYRSLSLAIFLPAVLTAFLLVPHVPATVCLISAAVVLVLGLFLYVKSRRKE